MLKNFNIEVSKKTNTDGVLNEARYLDICGEKNDVNKMHSYLTQHFFSMYFKKYLNQFI